MILTIYDHMRASHVKRWHIVNTTSQQSVAEHSFNVTIIALHLWSRIHIGGADRAIGMGEMLNLVLSALFHDIPEVRLGDIPTPAKAIIGRNIINIAERQMMPGIPYLDEEPQFYTIIKMADLIESAWWIRENGAGAHAEVVANTCWRKMEEYLHELAERETDDWYSAVNSVLTAIGMPYIQPEMKVSPP